MDYSKSYEMLKSLTKPVQGKECRDFQKELRGSDIDEKNVVRIIEAASSLASSDIIVKVVKAAINEPNGEIAKALSDGDGEFIKEYAFRNGWDAREPEIGF